MKNKESVPDFDITNDIDTYTKRTFLWVWDNSNEKWYIRNNQDHYEPYGVYAEDMTTSYEGKLAIVDGHEWEYTNGNWNDLGMINEIKQPTYIGKLSQAKGYIDLGLPFRDKIKIQVKFYPIKDNGGAIFGDEDGADENKDWRVFFSGNTLYYDFDNSRMRVSKQINNVYEWEIGNYYIKDINSSSHNIINGTAHTDFSNRTSNIQLNRGAGDLNRFYYVKIYDGESLVRDFVPYFDGSSYGLWDNVSNKAYMPTGEGWGGDGDDDGDIKYPKYYPNKTKPSWSYPIGEYAFYGCSNLQSVELSDDITSIGNYAFSGCSKLISMTIPNSVTTIGESAFYGCSGLTSIYLPSSIKSIGNNAFANCTELLDVYCYARKSPAMGTNAFANSDIQFTTLYVPEASLNGYKVTEPWSGFGNIKALSGEYPEVPETIKCATPTILHENGKLSFSCETEGARFVCNFSTPSESYEEGVAVNMPNKLQVSVYAKKEGFENSDVATKEIDLGKSGLRGDVNNDGQVSMPDAMFIVNKILNGKFPDEDLELEKAGVRFGFYEEVPGYSVKINKITVTGLRVAEFGSVGTTLKESNSDFTFDKTDGSYTNVYFKDANENPQMVVEVDYTLTSDDGTGETFTGKTITNIGLQSITQWEPNKNYTFIFKVVPTYLYGGIIDVEHPSIYFESVNVEGSGGMTR